MTQFEILRRLALASWFDFGNALVCLPARSAFAVSEETAAALTSDADMTDLTDAAAGEVKTFAADVASSYAETVAETLDQDVTTVEVCLSRLIHHPHRK